MPVIDDRMRAMVAGSRIDNKMGALVAEASRWVGVRELGYNVGPQVEAFQRAVDGKANGEPWCLAFVQYCVLAVDELMGMIPTTALYPTEHVINCWNRTPIACRRATVDVRPGDLIVWQQWLDGRATTAGHIGIVVEPIKLGVVRTIEGNTSVEGAVKRDGDQVARRARGIKGSGNLRVKGFLRPWVTA